jgi:glycosyltransferase involved in cell wall biosynthesis
VNPPSLAQPAFQCSIVIPLLRQNDAWLEQAVQSALAQTVRCEVIVVYSGPTPQSNLEVLHRLKQSNPNLMLACCERPSFPRGLNIGFMAASADRIGILLSDDWLDPPAVEVCLGHDADIVSTGHRFFAADGVTVFAQIDWTPNAKSYARLPSLERQAGYLKYFFLFRKSKLYEIGGADEAMGDFPGIDDYDMIWTLLEHGASVALVSASVYNIRDHDSERLTLKGREQSIQGLRRILRKHRVDEREAAELIEAHARWYGMPVHEAHRRIRAEDDPA